MFGTRTAPRSTDRLLVADWMNSGKLSYAVDFNKPSGLRGLLEVADVVIESSRPAALAHLRRLLRPVAVDGIYISLFV